MLLKVKQEHPKLTTLCGFKGDETSIDFRVQGLCPADAMLIAPEISVMASLTEARCLRCAPLKLLPSQPHLSAQVNLRDNQFGKVGWCTIFDTLRENPQNKISKWDLTSEGINPTIAKSLADYAAVSASLTSADFSFNHLGAEGAKALAPAIAGSASLIDTVGYAA